MSGDSATGAGRDGNFNYQCWSLFAQTFWRASQAWTINALRCIMRIAKQWWTAHAQWAKKIPQKYPQWPE